MKTQITSVVSKTLPILVIVATWTALVRTNYTPGTWLTGWDNLQSELNLAVNIKRSLTATWQEYQGLGLLGGMAHAADLPRQLILLTLSLFIPTHMLRYIWTFLMLLIGPLGIYFLVDKVLQGKKKYKLAGLVSGLFYLLNFGTVQNFFTPFETFIAFYGFFPWLIYSALTYLKEGTKKGLLKFFIISLFATPAFYTQTLFIVYSFCLSVFITEYLIVNKKKALKKILKLLIVLISANAFWLFPVIIFTLNNSQVVFSSKINKIATPETQLMNWGTGNFKDIALLRGFWYHYTDYFAKFDFLMRDWRVYFESTKPQVFGYVLFIVSIIGLLISIFNKKNIWRFSWIAIFVFCVFMLLGINPPTGFVYKAFTNTTPIINQIFRATFTKLSVTTIFIYAIGIGYFVNYISSFTKNKTRIFSVLLSSCLVFFSLLTVLPVFEGKLIANNMKKDIPIAYMQTIEFFKNQPKQARIARFPAQVFWSWDFYDWGYRGSGLLWYGIEQPILDRAFDVWSKHNEAYYQQISTATYGEDWEAMLEVLDKYDVSYVLLDKSVIAPDRDAEFLRIDKVKSKLEQAGGKLVLSNDIISIYDITSITNVENFISTPEKYISALANLDYSRRDPVYQQHKDYITKTNLNTKYYPFTQLLKENLGNIAYEENESLTKIYLNNNTKFDKGKLVIPALSPGEKISVLTEITLNEKDLIVDFLRFTEISLDNQVLDYGDLPEMKLQLRENYPDLFVTVGDSINEISRGETKQTVVKLTVDEPISLSAFDKNKGKNVDLKQDFLSQKVSKCWEKAEGKGVIEAYKQAESLSIKTKDAAGCLSFNLEHFGTQKSLLRVTLPYQSDELNPYFCVLKQGELTNCLNDDNFSKTPLNNNWQEVTRDVIIENNINIWLSIAARSSDQPQTEANISYQSPKVINYPLAENIYVDKRIWKKYIQDSNLDIDNTELISVNFYAKPNEIDIGKLERANNCDIHEQGWIKKEIGKDFVSFKAGDRGALCDYATVSEVNTSQNYIVRFIGKNITGNSLKYYITNKASFRADLEETLPSGSFDSSYLLLSWPNLDKDGYTLNFQNKSFGGELSENKLEKVIFYSAPLEWLSRWFVEKNEDSKPIKNNLAVNKVNKTGTYKYQVEVEGNGLLALSQGYNDGWIALNNFQLLEHVKVNSWANGWLIEDQSPASTILIIFWLQYLQYFGFTLMPLTLVLFIKRRTK